MKKVYLVYVEWGEHSDYTSHVDRTFDEKGKADRYADDMNERSKKDGTGMHYWVEEREIQ